MTRLEPLETVLAAMGRSLPPGAAAAFEGYLDLLLEARSRFNLVGTADPAELAREHLADSLWLLPVLEEAGARRVVDIGSGAGFPGMPLAIVMPGTGFVLVDSREKRAAFLEDTACRLALPNVQAVRGRAETLGHAAGWRESFDAAVARAVADLAELAELALPLVRRGGVLAALKGREVEPEIRRADRAIRELGGGEVRCQPTPSGRGTCVVVAAKVNETPSAYPRKPGQPHKRPLR